LRSRSIKFNLCIFILAEMNTIMYQGHKLYRIGCFCLTFLLLAFSFQLQAQSPTDSLLRVRQDLTDVLDSAKAGTIDTTVLSLGRLLMASEELVAFDNDLINNYLLKEKAIADSLQTQFSLQQTDSLNDNAKIDSMNTLILTAWAVTAVSIFLFLIMLILYLKTARQKKALALQHADSERTLLEYRKKLPEFQAENDFLKEKLEEKNPEKDYLKEKLKNYQDEMERIGADKRALIKDIQNILDRVKDL